MPDELNEQTSCANTTVQKVFGTKKVHNTRNKKSISRHKTYNLCEISRQIPKNGYQTATTKQNNLPPMEAWTKNIATKMADSEFWNKNKISKAELTNKNTRKMS